MKMADQLSRGNNNKGICCLKTLYGRQTNDVFSFHLKKKEKYTKWIP
jgi:hypothetical protein